MTEDTTPKTRRTRNVDPAKKQAKADVTNSMARLTAIADITTALSNAGVDMTAVTPVLDGLLNSTRDKLKSAAETAYPELADVLTQF